jgi:hypothetical protein
MRTERCATRFALNAPIEFTLWDPRKNFFGFATDISTRGVFIETAFPARPASDLAIRIWPWGWGEEVVVTGVVRWMIAIGMGVEFTPLGPRETRAVQDLVIDWQRPRDSARHRLTS